MVKRKNLRGRRITVVLSLIIGCVAALSFAPTARAAPPNDPVSQWPLDDGLDPTADAVDSNPADLACDVALCPGPTYVAATAPVPNNVNKLQFDSDPPNQDYLEVAWNANLDFTTAYSYSGWLEIDDFATYRPIAVRGTTDNNDIEIYVQPAPGGDLIVAHNRGNGGLLDYVGFADPPLGAEFHLVVTFDSGTVQAYYDGVPATVTQTSGAPSLDAPTATNGSGWWFGKVDHSAFGGAETFYFEGTMDEVVLFNRAVSASEIALLGGDSRRWVDDDGVVGFNGSGGVDCDGEGLHAFTEIQDAIDAATAGDTINVCAGTYTGDVEINTDGITLLGAKAGVDGRSRGPSFNPAESTIDGPSALVDKPKLKINADHVTVKGFFFNGNTNGPAIQTAGLTAAADFADIRDNVITGNVFGVYLNGHQLKLVRNNIVANNAAGSANGTGIYSDQGMIEVTIDQNNIRGNDNASIIFAVTPEAQRTITVSNNALADGGILLWNTDRLTITNNTISLTPGSAIYAAGDNDDLMIDHNTISNAGRSAVTFDNFNVAAGDVGSNDRARVLANTLQNSADYGLRVWDEGPGVNSFTDLIAQNNRIVGNGLGGILNEDVGVALDGRRNWWGNASGPSVWSIGTGQSVSANVDVFPWAKNSATTTFVVCTKTASGNTPLIGTAGNDILCGTDGTNTIRGGNGNDLILGNGGNDSLQGQGNDDRIFGDRVGSAGNDTINGGAGVDFGQGRGGTDTFISVENQSDF